jgi:hypothetical protein
MDKWLCLALYVKKYKIQASNQKHNAKGPERFKIPTFNDKNVAGEDIVWILEFWSRAAQALALRVRIF